MYNNDFHYYEAEQIDKTTGRVKPGQEAKFKFADDADFFGKATGIKAKTAASKAGKFGKDSSNYTNIQELQPKAQRKMQQQEKKGGGNK